MYTKTLLIFCLSLVFLIHDAAHAEIKKIEVLQIFWLKNTQTRMSDSWIECGMYVEYYKIMKSCTDLMILEQEKGLYKCKE
jgi:hypothetical protein